MSAKVMNGEMMAISAMATTAAEAKPELMFAKCECCGLTEECTPAYVARVRERFSGRWVCGLCGEAVKDEICRAGLRISTEEALRRHMKFSESFRSGSPSIHTEDHLITAMRQLLRRSLDSPRTTRSTPTSPRRREVEEDSAAAAARSMARSGSCVSTLAQ